MFCIEEDLQSKLGEINGSELVNRLLKQHFDGDFGKDEKVLRAKYDDFRAEKTILLRKMKHISTILGKIMAAKEAKHQKGLDAKTREAREKEVEAHKQRYYTGEIDAEEYSRFFDD